MHHDPLNPDLHNPDLKDVALGVIIGQSINQPPPPPTGSGGFGGVIFVAVLLGVADIPAVPALWSWAGDLISQSIIGGALCFLFTAALALFPIVLFAGAVSAASAERQAEAQWRQQQEESRQEQERRKVEAARQDGKTPYTNI